MTAVGCCEALKKVSSKYQRRKERRKERRKTKGKFRLKKRLEKYKELLEQTKVARAKTSSLFRVEIPGKFLEISSRIVALANNPVAVQLPLSPFQANPLVAMSGNCFWMNYQNVFNWKDRHTSNLSANSSPRPLQQPTARHPYHQIYQECRRNHSQAAHAHQDDEPYINNSTAVSEFHEVDEEYNEEGAAFGEEEDGERNDGGNDSDSDIVVTEEMMQFLEISMRHKAKREREKLAAKELERKKWVEERDAIEDCQVPTEEDENEKRLREMSELYGKDAAKIHGMETALQLNFNRQLDLFNPSYWPFYPFSMQFKGVTSLK